MTTDFRLPTSDLRLSTSDFPTFVELECPNTTRKFLYWLEEVIMNIEFNIFSLKLSVLKF